MLSGLVIPGLSVALLRSFDCRLGLFFDFKEKAGHSVIVCARLSGWKVQQYRRRVFIASNRLTAPHYFR